MKDFTIDQWEAAKSFIEESNRIEGIIRSPTREELAAFRRFMQLDKVTVKDLETFVKVYQPDARLRDKAGLDVHIGVQMPPRGGPEIRTALQDILSGAVRRPWLLVTKDRPDSAYSTHVAYEHLHPFTDGNGRSGRMLWAWQMRDFPLGFLHHFYYQTLANSRL